MEYIEYLLENKIDFWIIHGSHWIRIHFFYKWIREEYELLSWSDITIKSFYNALSLFLKNYEKHRKE